MLGAWQYDLINMGMTYLICRAILRFVLPVPYALTRPWPFCTSNFAPLLAMCPPALCLSTPACHV